MVWFNSPNHVSLARFVFDASGFFRGFNIQSFGAAQSAADRKRHDLVDLCASLVASHEPRPSIAVRSVADPCRFDVVFEFRGARWSQPAQISQGFFAARQMVCVAVCCGGNPSLLGGHDLCDWNCCRPGTKDVASFCRWGRCASAHGVFCFLVVWLFLFKSNGRE